MTINSFDMINSDIKNCWNEIEEIALSAAATLSSSVYFSFLNNDRNIRKLRECVREMEKLVNDISKTREHKSMAQVDQGN